MTRSLRSLRNALTALLGGYKLSRGFWLFFIAALCWDAGFGLYFFLFNLYLLDFHFNERAIGLISGALSLGVVAGTLPAGILTRRIGARRLLIFSFIGAPVLSVIRAIFVWEPAAIAFAFIAGVVMCIWTVCFLPVTASLTSESDRGAATGLIFSVGIGAAALGAAVSGYLSRFIGVIAPGLGPAEIKRILLLVACGVVACGFMPLTGLSDLREISPQLKAFRENFAPLRNSFFRRFLPCIVLWSSLIGAFTPFASVYFVQQRHVSLPHVGLIISASQIAQLVGGLLVPLAERSLGMIRSIVISQLATGFLLALTVLSPSSAACIGLFCAYSASQWICSPAMYTLLMNNLAETDRAGASAIVMFSNFLLTAATTSVMGILLLHSGYPTVLIAIGAVECILAVGFWLFIPRRVTTAEPISTRAESFTD